MSAPASTPTDPREYGTETITVDDDPYKTYHKYNSISDYDPYDVNILDPSSDIGGKDPFYPLTDKQMEYIRKNAPKATDSRKVQLDKALSYRPPVSSLFDRIKARFTPNYLESTVALLGYDAPELAQDICSDIANGTSEYTIKQVLNHIFKSDVNGKPTDFTMEKFLHRPIFCGVNVLYDPTASDTFIKTRHKDDYFNGAWDESWDETVKDNDTGVEYKNGNFTTEIVNGKERIVNRDITFSYPFLNRLKNKAEENGYLTTLFVRNGFSVGLTYLDPFNLGLDRDAPVQMSRVFIAYPGIKDSYDYTTVLMNSEVRRLDLEEKKDGDDDPYRNMTNDLVQVLIPKVVDYKGNTDQESRIVENNVNQPPIIFAGETAGDGYELASFTAIPVCSWTDFQNNPYYKDTKAVQRLTQTYTCGPFTRVIANGYYSTTVSAILETYTEIVIEKNDKDELFIHTDIPSGDGKYTKDNIEHNKIDENLRNVAATMLTSDETHVYKESDADNADLFDLMVYEDAYERNMVAKTIAEGLIKKLFDVTYFPKRFAVFRFEKDIKKVYIRQYPAIPILNEEPLSDDYITQLVPMYRKTDGTDQEQKGIKWYINMNDILLDHKNVPKGKFYNVAQQKSERKTYENPKTGDGFMFTYTGHLFKGAKEEDNSGFPKSIDGIEMGNVNSNLKWSDKPITIAMNNTLQFFTIRGTNEGNASRTAYIDFIRQGCVWRDVNPKDLKCSKLKSDTSKLTEIQGGEEPRKYGAENTDDQPLIPDTDPIGYTISTGADDTTDTTETAEGTEENKESFCRSKCKCPMSKANICIIVVAIIVAICLISGALIYIILKNKKRSTPPQINEDIKEESP